MTSRFLVRPRPFPQESLSSWRQRLGWANGYRLFPVKDERSRRTDPDFKVGVEELAWLHSLSMESMDEICRLTLLGAGLVDLGRSRHPLWVIPCRSHTNAKWGAGVCLACLAEDKEPYMRLEWRMGYVLGCAKHRVWLTDQCPSCQCAFWPTAGSVAHVLHNQYTSHAICWSCGVDLRLYVPDIRPKHACMESVVDLMRSLGGNSISKDVSDQSLLCGLHELCQLKLRLSKECAETNLNRVEILCIKDRISILTQVLTWLDDFPNGLLRAAKLLGFSRTHFNGRYAHLPPWLRAVVDHGLAKQIRGSASPDLGRLFAEPFSSQQPS